MPKPKHSTLIQQAVARAKRLMPTYPTHFHDIEAAKTFIATVCSNASFIYCPPTNLTEEDEAYIKDKVHFVVAVHAFEQGEFYLKNGLRDRAALRSAIESDIHRLLTRHHITTWPPHFPHAHAAKMFVRSTARANNFRFSAFEGVSPQTFEGYVCFQTARRGFEAGGFELRDAIESDIHRLSPHLSPLWPPHFSSLNAARNFVARVCREAGFRYEGWPGLGMERFKLFVHFRTAEREWGLGRFGVGDGVEVEMRKEEVKEGEVDKSSKTMAVEKSSPALGMLKFNNNKSSPIPDLLLQNLTPTTTVHPSPTPLIADASNPQDQTEQSVSTTDKRDPFKDLIAELGRVFILKAAFE
ncbi:hypothetical protein BDW02DRAFT_600197 [Decorospora gaudefroyi]|uniref:Uncharacterized protein n=1 Tax=Decorospora gaudefroyi TaxID=184978 RepID=A0A6A5K5U7_9PLEO|nr:hypothetical protein BDW02DRAFT_600197 [Decorospora gaudefroyi]